jgi:AcrR family transcriptional regulator
MSTEPRRAQWGAMATRAETTAATRQALVAAAGALLDAGGPEAVTLREVGAQAGVSRSAPYRHFPAKEHLLTELATRAWQDVGDQLEALAAVEDLTPTERLRAALTGFVALGRARPHLHRLMFAVPSSDPEAVVRAAERSQDLYVDLVARVVGPEHAREHAALLMTSAHGIAGLEVSGHLDREKWGTDADALVALLIGLLPGAAS